MSIRTKAPINEAFVLMFCGVRETMFEYVRDMINSGVLRNQKFIFEVYGKIFVLKSRLTSAYFESVT